MTGEVLGSHQLHADAATADATASAPYPDAATRWYSVGVFSVVLMFLVLDRNVITLLVQPIKRDLALNDTQMSFLLGLAPVIFYACIGIPLSRLVDRYSRRLLLAGGIIFWSIATVLCGIAKNFWQLFIFRVGVGAGESFNAPATFSMMADMFPRDKLPRALAVLNVGFVCGTGISLIAGGAVIALLAGVPDFHIPIVGLIRNWQLVFIIVGIPGILVGLILILTVKEPARRGRMLQGAKPQFVPLKDVVRFWISNWKVYAPMFLGLAVSSIENSGTQIWRPAFFERTFGWQPAQIGLYTGLSAVLLAPFGLWLGTFLAEHFIKKGQDDGNMRVVALVYSCGVPFAVLAPLMPNPWLALGVGAVGGIVGMASAPAFNAALQLVTPNEMRGQMTALYIFVFSVIGSGFGPTFIALITDYILHDENQIRFALSGSAAIMGPLAAFIIWRGIKAYGEAYTRSKQWD